MKTQKEKIEHIYKAYVGGAELFMLTKSLLAINDNGYVNVWFLSGNR